MASRPESAEFLGFIADRIDVAPVSARSVTPRSGGGAVIGAYVPKARLISVQGWMWASSQCGMEWGQRWLSDVLAGSCGGCAADTLEILPCCPDELDPDPERHFRTLYQVGIVDGPVFDENVACVGQQVSFQLLAGIPYLYGPPDLCMDAVEVGAGAECCLVSTEEWNGDATLRITLAASIADVRDVEVTLTPTFDGLCPAGPQAPCVTYRIPFIAEDDQLVIDGVIREVRRYDATSKTYRAGLGSVEFDGLFIWPDVAPCSQACLCITVDGAYGGVLTATVESLPREL